METVFGRTPGRTPDQDTDPDQSSDIETKKGSWWTFDVYYNFADTAVNYCNLPCWMARLCEGTADSNDVWDPATRISDTSCNVNKPPACIPATSSINDDIFFKPLSYLTIVKNNYFYFLNIIREYSNNITKQIAGLITNKQTVQAAENFPPFVSGRGIDYDASFPNKSQVEINTYIIISSSGNGPSELIGTYENREGILLKFMRALVHMILYI